MALITLDNDTKKLQVLLSGAVSANECPMTAVVKDVRKDAIGGREDSGVERTYDSITTGATAVDLVPAAPSNVRRQVTGFSLHNADSAAVTVTVRLYVNSTTTRILWKGAIQTLENLYYTEDRGWFATDANANQKSNASSTSGATSEALSAALSVSTIVSTNLSVTGSQNTSQSSTVSTALSTAGSQDVSQSSNVSTALSTGTSQNTSQSVNLSVVKSTADSG